MIKVIGEINANTLSQFFDRAEYYPEDGVMISSPGGDIGYTLAMLDDIDEFKRPTRATGICQSAAAVLATAGEGHRVCTMDALFRFIPPEPEDMKDPETGIISKKIPDLRWYLHTVLVARLAQRLKRDKVEVYELFDGEFISSTRAKELGLVDEVISTEVRDGNSNRLSGSEGQASEPEIGEYDKYASGVAGSRGEVRVQSDSENNTDSYDFGWPV